MAKQGMKRPDANSDRPDNTEPTVPEIQGRAKHGKSQADHVSAGTSGPSKRVWNNKGYSWEKPVSSAYSDIDNDLARDNMENDIPEADLQDI